MEQLQNLLLLITIVITFPQGHQCFFIKHSSGQCVATRNYPFNSGYWGANYKLDFTNECTKRSAQFRFLNNGVIYSPLIHGFIYYNAYVYVDRLYVYSARRSANYGNASYNKHAFEHTPGYSLRLIRLNKCMSPTGRYWERYSHFLPRSPCGQESQRVVFGSVTCYGNATRDINCSANQTIVILNADYGGLADMKTCGYNENINRNISATCLVKNQCDGKQWCNITVDHRLFEVDPFPGKSKYLYIEHKCVDKDSFSKPFGTVSGVKLSESPSPNEGFLEVNFNNKTAKVCTSSDQVGDVVCRYLGYSGRKQLPTKTTFSGISRHLDGFTADLTCSGLEPDLSSCCAKGTTAKDRNCSSLLYISCTICSEPLLEDREKFADYIFTASKSIDEHTAEKARLSSNSSWCAPTNGSEFLQIDLGRAYIVNKVATFGDARTANFVTSYKLVLSQDGSHWRSGSVEGDEIITGNTDAFNSVAIRTLDGENIARFVRFLPKESVGERCIRVELCGHTFYPDKPRNFTLVYVTSSSVIVSWIPPANSGHKPLKGYRITVERGSSVADDIDMLSTDERMTVHNLESSTMYIISIEAKNSDGFSDRASIEFETREAEIACECHCGSLTAILTLLVVILIVIILSLIFAGGYFFKRHRNFRSNSKAISFTKMENKAFEEYTVSLASGQENNPDQNSNSCEELQFGEGENERYSEPLVRKT